MTDEQIKAFLGMGTNWPMTDVLAKLVHAAEHLLDAHSCDVDGHEEIRAAVNVAKSRLAVLRRA